MGDVAGDDTVDTFLAEYTRPAARSRVPKQLVERQGEQKRLLKTYDAWKANRVDELLAGPYGHAFRPLIDFLADLNTRRPAELVEFVKSGPWGNADLQARNEALGLISDALIKVREHRGLIPFDDPLPDEPLNAFFLLRDFLT